MFKMYEKIKEFSKVKMLLNNYEEAPRSRTLSQLEVSLKPLFFAMRLLGMHHRFGDKDLWTLYSIIVAILLSCSFIRSLIQFDTNEQYGSLLFSKIQWCLLSFQCLIIILLFQLSFRRGGNFEAFFIYWEKLFAHTDINRCPKYILIISVILPAVNLLANFSGVILSFYIEPNIGNTIARVSWFNYNKDIERNLKLQMINVSYYEAVKPTDFRIKDITDDHIHRAFITLLFITKSGITCFSGSFFVVLCILVGRQFDRLADNFAKSITTDGRLLCDLSQTRFEYQSLVELIDLMNASFSGFLAIILFSDIGIFSLNFYNLIFFQDSPGYHTVLFSIWYAAIFIHLVSVAGAAARVGFSAHKLLPHLYNVRFCRHTEHFGLEMMLLLGKLNGDQVGLTVLHLFMVTWRTILKVAGLLFTYLVLLIQFRDSHANKLHKVTV